MCLVNRTSEIEGIHRAEQQRVAMADSESIPLLEPEPELGVDSSRGGEPGGEQLSGHATCKKCGVQVHRTSLSSFSLGGCIYTESLSGAGSL